MQDQVAAEAQATIGSGAVDARQVERLTFTRQVLQEAMRLYPRVTLRPRAGMPLYIEPR